MVVVRGDFLVENDAENADEQTKYDVIHTLVDCIKLSLDEHCGIKVIIGYKFSPPEGRIRCASARAGI